MELRSILKSTKVGNVTLKSAPVVSPSDTLERATAEMRQHGHGCALVCVDDRLTAIITERDILKYLSRQADLGIPIQQIMTAQPRTVKEDDTLFSAVKLMDEGGYRRLPVVDANNRPLGIVDVKIVTHFLVEHFPSAVYNQAAITQLIPQRREGA